MDDRLDRAPKQGPNDLRALAWPPRGLLERFKLWWFPRPVDVASPVHCDAFYLNVIRALDRAGGELPARTLNEALLPIYGRINRPSYYLAMARMEGDSKVTRFERNGVIWYRLRRDEDRSNLPTPVQVGRDG